MTYANSVTHPDVETFCTFLEEARVRGAIVPDLPVDEFGDVRRSGGAHGIDVVLLAAPGTTPSATPRSGRPRTGSSTA
jgi:tryptophan synthase alpha chain